MVEVNALLHSEPEGGVEAAIGATALALSRHLAPGSVRLWVPPSLAARLAPSHNIRVIPVRGRLSRILAENRATRATADAPWHHLGYVAPLLQRSRFALTVYDLTAVRHPELTTRHNRLYFGLRLMPSIRRAAAVIVPSRFVADQVRAALGTSTRVHCLPLPLPGEPSAEAPPLPLAERRHLLFAGDLGPKKNPLFLLRLAASLPEALRRRFPLLIAGKAHGRGRAEAELRRLGISATTRFLPWQSPEQLRELLRTAAVLLYPSRDEGYGFPPLEAACMGTPSLVSDRGALPEIAGSVATVLPLSLGIFRTELLKLLTEPQHYAEAAARAFDHRPRLSWEQYAADVQAIHATL